MLFLTRKLGEAVIINGTTEVVVMKVRGRSVRLGFTYPADTSVLRQEIFDRIKEENLAATRSGIAPQPDTALWRRTDGEDGEIPR